MNEIDRNTLFDMCQQIRSNGGEVFCPVKIEDVDRLSQMAVRIGGRWFYAHVVYDSISCITKNSEINPKYTESPHIQILMSLYTEAKVIGIQGAPYIKQGSLL